MTRSPRRPRRAALAALALALAGTGCQAAIATTTTTGPGAPMTVTPVNADLVRAFGLDGVGQGPVSWWASGGEVQGPAEEVTPLSSFVPVAGVAITDVIHANVTTAPTALSAPEVVLRPAWSTTVDTRDSATATSLGVADEVTISFATPGAPGQFPDDANREVLEVATQVTVPPGTCEDVVGLQVWQVGPPEVDAFEGAVQADYLGSLLVRTDCA